MGGYIGATAVGLVTTAADVQGDITSTDTTPELILKNTSEEDTDGGREGKVTFKGQQSGGEESTLAQIQASHDGTSDDQKGDLIFKTNDGSDGASPTERIRIDSAGKIGIGGSPTSRNVELIDTNPTLAILSSSASGVSQLLFGDPDDDNIGRIYYGHTDNEMRFYTNASENMRIDSSGNVGIGTTPSTLLHIKGANPEYRIEDNNETGSANIVFRDSARETAKISVPSGSSASMQFQTLGSEAMRINSSGDLLAGTTNNLPSSNNVEGIALSTGSYNGYLSVSRAGDVVDINRKDSDGGLVFFRKDGSVVGNVFSSGGIQMGIGTGDTAILFAANADAWLPWNTDNTQRDNAIDLGRSATRFDDVYATNGTIQTSDENEKQDIASLTSAEITAATAISKLFKTYRWKDKVSAKGDNARTHTGVVAQQVKTAMSNAGLDASKYAFWCSNTWWEKDVEVAAVEEDKEKNIKAKDAYTRTDVYDTKDEAPEGATEHTRLGVRYPELLAFIGAATEQRLTSIESRLTALEG